MYTCKRCSCNLEDKDRFCHNCGAYIGEPIRKKPEWEQSYSLDIDEKCYEIAEENEEVEKLGIFKNNKIEELKAETMKQSYKIKGILKDMIIRPVASIEGIASTLPVRLAIILTVLMAGMFSLILTASIKFLFKDTESLITALFSILPIHDLVNKLTSIPQSMAGIAVSAFFLFIFVVIVFFSITYLTGYYLFKASCRLRHLWNVIILSFIPLQIGFIFCIFSFSLMPIIGILILIVILMLWIILLHKGIKAMMDINEDKSIYAAASGCIAMIFGIIVYIFVLMR